MPQKTSKTGSGWARARLSAFPLRLRPRKSSVGLENLCADIEFVAREFVHGRAGDRLAEDISVPADELHAVLARRLRSDRDRYCFCAILAHVSRSETVRLNTIAVSRESLSTQK